jgi:hypothetical protein
VIFELLQIQAISFAQIITKRTASPHQQLIGCGGSKRTGSDCSLVQGSQRSPSIIAEIASFARVKVRRTSGAE